MSTDAKVSGGVQDFYDGYYDGASEWRRLGAIDKVANIVRLSEAYQPSRILEIGSGEGSVLDRLSTVGFGQSLYSLEISESGVSAIKQRCISNLEGCLLYDGYNIPYGDRVFDLAVLTHVLEHVEHPRLLLYEVARVAKRVFVEVPLEDNLKLSGTSGYTDIGHINFYSRKTIGSLLASCGLTVLEEAITLPSYRTFVFRCRRVAPIRYVPKALALALAPGLATLVWTYHGAYLCEPARTQ